MKFPLDTFIRPIMITTQLLFKFFDYFWPKDKSLLVFAGYGGLEFSDNSKHLFLNFVDHYSDEFKIVWITRNKNIENNIDLDIKYRSKILYQFSLKGLLTLLRAHVVFYVMGVGDIPGVSFSRKTITIQLWHGIPIKRIENCSINEGKSFYSIVVQHLFSNYSYWICSSSIDRNSTALCVRLPIDKVVITGYPRNDCLIKHKNELSLTILKKFPYLNKKIILYAPTWRDGKDIHFFPFDKFSLQDLNTFLELNDAILLLRGHRHQNTFKYGITKDNDLINNNRILSANSDIFDDIQELLPFVDILISDYSGIWVDFLLLDRPIIFIPYDLDEYERERGLLYNYNFITPGPKISSLNDLIDAMQEYFEEPKKDSEKRLWIKKIFHEYDDGLSYKRIRDLIKL